MDQQDFIEGEQEQFDNGQADLIDERQNQSEHVDNNEQLEEDQEIEYAELVKAELLT